MQTARLQNIVKDLNNPHTCLDFYEFKKARLIYNLLVKTRGDFTHGVFDEFMHQADILEVSIYERLRIEAAQDFDKYPSEAWFRAETFREMEKELGKIRTIPII